MECPPQRRSVCRNIYFCASSITWTGAWSVAEDLSSYIGALVVNSAPMRPIGPCGQGACSASTSGRRLPSSRSHRQQRTSIPRDRRIATSHTHRDDVRHAGSEPLVAPGAVSSEHCRRTLLVSGALLLGASPQWLRPPAAMALKTVRPIACAQLHAPCLLQRPKHRKQHAHGMWKASHCCLHAGVGHWHVLSHAHAILLRWITSAHATTRPCSQTCMRPSSVQIWDSCTHAMLHKLAPAPARAPMQTTTYLRQCSD